MCVCTSITFKMYKYRLEAVLSNYLTLLANEISAFYFLPKLFS